jgi:hypothetical protein
MSSLQRNLLNAEQSLQSIRDSKEKILALSARGSACCQIDQYCDFESSGVCNFKWCGFSLKGCGRRFCLYHKGFPGYCNKNMVSIPSAVCIHC